MPCASMHANGWASIDLAGGATMYLQERAGTWHVRAGRLGEWQVEYAPGDGTFPSSVRLSASMPVEVDQRAGLTHVETNIDVDPAAFEVRVPPDAEALTLDDLRLAGPLQAP